MVANPILSPILARKNTSWMEWGEREKAAGFLAIRPNSPGGDRRLLKASNYSDLGFEKIILQYDGQPGGEPE